MDFAFTDEQEALRQLARKILDDHATPERLKAVEAETEWFDRTLWAALAGADLLGVALPSEYGGSGLGVLELCILLEEIGRAAAPIPAWATLALAALAIAEFGTREQRAAWLPGVARGDTILTAALVEPHNEDPAAVCTTARRDGSQWRLNGVKTCVPAAHLAARVIVPARTTDSETALFLLDPQSAGVELQRQTATNREPQCTVAMADVRVAAADMLGTPTGGAAALQWILDRAVVGLCALQTGVTDRALRITAEYTSKREQFGKPIATFQAVAQRAADCFIDVEAVRWTMWQAAWRLAAGRDARTEIGIAKFWASDAGHRITYAAQHLHGGIGLDQDYPVHRYFLWSKTIELSLGSTTRQLQSMGRAMAEPPAS